MAHPLSPHFSLSDFYATFLTHNTTMLEAFVFTTEALIVFDRTKNLRTEQTISFWLERTVVDCLWLLHLAK